MRVKYSRLVPDGSRAPPFFSTDGYFDPDLTPESVAEHIDQVRATDKGEFVSSCVDVTLRYARFCPRLGSATNILPK